MPPRSESEHPESKVRQLENIYLREDEILRRISAGMVMGIEPKAGRGSIQEVVDFLRSNDMVVEVYGSASWAVTDLA